jgi:hypothetical protein
MAILMSCATGSQKEKATILPAEPDGSFPALTEYHKTLPVDKINLPAGFKIDVYAEVNNARSLDISP